MIGIIAKWTGLSTVAAWVLIVMIGFTVFSGYVAFKQTEAVQAERARLNQANQAVRDLADKAGQTVQTCLGTWNRETSRCDR